MNYTRENSKAAALETFHGLWAAMTTPFTIDDQLDESALIKDIDILVDDLKIDGVFCTGVMGEFWALTLDERKRAVEVIVENTRGRIPVLAHTGSHSARETIELTRHAQETGADFVVVINPVYPPGSEAGLKRWFLEILDAVDIGVWLFDTNYSGVSLPLSLIDELADVENVCGIKMAHGHDRYLEVLNKVGDRMMVCEPSEADWLENMRDHNQKVYMSASTPFLIQTPARQAMLEYTTAALAKDFATAEAISREIQPIRDLTEKWLHGRWKRDRINPVPAIKYWSGLLGMSGGSVRPPLMDLSDEQKRELRGDLERVGLI